MGFIEKLASASRRNDSLLCVGLDPDRRLIPGGLSIADFNREIIGATADLVSAYKPNIAFYEAGGRQGLAALEDTLKSIPGDIPVILDAKRGDIGNSARAYAAAIFDVLGCDAATVSPYLGLDSIEPFLEYADRGVFLLCRTSNPGAGDFQSLPCLTDEGNRPLFEVVARKARQWNTRGNIGLVVGATYPEEMGLVRQVCPDMLLLVPGIGAQGGDVAATVRNGVDARGRGMIINSSRQVLYASRGKDFAGAARQAALQLRDQINRCIRERE